MKYFIKSLFILLSISILTINSKSLEEIQLTNPNFNCDGDFFSLRAQDGAIQKWIIDDDTIIGGETILYCDGASLSHCGNICQPTFYSTNFPETGITYYDTILNWVEIPTLYPVLNNGGYKNHQFFMKKINQNVTVLDYFDGTNLITIDSLIYQEFAVADIAVDTLGRAWVFTGPGFFNADSLSVYDNNGKITSYLTSIDTYNAYGSFFIGNQLYIGFGPYNIPYKSSIVPVLIDGDSANLGNPIFFNDEYYSDLASCQFVDCRTSANKLIKKSNIIIFPNPTSDNVYIQSTERLLSIELFSITGEHITSFSNENILYLNELPPGGYLLIINTENEFISELIIKN